MGKRDHRCVVLFFLFFFFFLLSSLTIVIMLVSAPPPGLSNFREMPQSSHQRPDSRAFLGNSFYCLFSELLFFGLQHLLSWSRFTLPFDRHDWFLDRCGTEVHYVVDFYRGQPVKDKPIALHIDARPALDSLTNVVDRLRKFGSHVTSHMFGAPPH